MHVCTYLLHNPGQAEPSFVTNRFWRLVTHASHAAFFSRVEELIDAAGNESKIRLKEPWGPSQGETWSLRRSIPTSEVGGSSPSAPACICSFQCHN